MKAITVLIILLGVFLTGCAVDSGGFHWYSRYDEDLDCKAMIDMTGPTAATLPDTCRYGTMNR